MTKATRFDGIKPVRPPNGWSSRRTRWGPTPTKTGTHQNTPEHLPPTPELGQLAISGEKVTVYEGLAIATGATEEHTRGYGVNYITETTGLAEAELETVLNEHQRVIQDGDVTYVIGEGASEKELIILSIIGGTLMAGNGLDRTVEHEGSKSNCNGENFQVETDNERGEEGNPEHTLRDEKPINDLDTLDDIIKNPTRIIDFGNRRYLFKVFDDGATTVIKRYKNPKYEIDQRKTSSVSHEKART